MISILTPQQMKFVDDYAIRTLRIPPLTLMENAGREVVDVIESNIGKLSNRSVLIFCGKGNNGGDGFVAARVLNERGAKVTVVLMENENELSGDALSNFQKLHNYKNTRSQIFGFEKIREQKNKKFDVIVDAMLGTSFRGELKGKYRKVVEWCNKQPALKIAVDIPTGLNGETGEVLSDAFCADVTVTMSNPKIGFYRERAKEFTGEVIVANIGIPNKVIAKVLSLRVPMQSERSNPHGKRRLLRNSSDYVGRIPRNDSFKFFLVQEDDVRKTFPKRASNSHKHSVGKIFALAGSKSMMGAALLCSQSAMRSGAGQVILGIPDSEYSTIAKRTLEVMPLGLPSTSEGSISFSAKKEIEKRIAWSTVLLIGCGMSRNAETQQLIRETITASNKPMVIDADGLNALVEHLDVLKKRTSKHIVVTPHVGEFLRLTGISSKEIEKNKFSLTSNFAKKFNLTLVLKGAPTIIADAQGNIFVNSTGNPGMSTAGSGDVLAGIIASLIGQGNSSLDAAINGVYLHGRAGDIASEKIGTFGMIASDMIKFLPKAIKEEHL